MRHVILFCILLCFSSAFAAYNTLVPAEGFTVELYADNIDNARVPRFDEKGRLLVSSPGAGAVYIIEPDTNNPGKALSKEILIDNLDRPHGLDFYEGYLYIAEVTQIIRMKYDHETGEIGEPEVVVEGIPNQISHARRALRFHDDWMYLGIGSTCNSCIEKNPRHASIERFRPDGSEYEVVGTGIRNAVDFNWAPFNNKLYAVVNARDLLGDHFPPDTVIEVKQGGFYGWPYANGSLVPDPLLGNSKKAKEKIATAISPVYELHPHVAPLGISFLDGEKLPEGYHHAALVGLHGSWNSTTKVGYKIVSLHWGESGNITERDFLTGFMRESDQKVFGRPVSAEQGPDGAIYITDDYADNVYRVSVSGQHSGLDLAAPNKPQFANPLQRMPEEERAQRTERGMALFQQFNCAICHEQAQAGPGVAVIPLENLGAKYNLAGMMDFLANPTPPMPAFPMSKEERKDLAVYLIGYTEH